MLTLAVGIGSNLDDRITHVEQAFSDLERLGEVVAVSSLYETAPVGGPDQGPYINAVAVIVTELAPREVMDGLLAIESEHGRVRRERWGPRVLDLDLLVYDTVEIAGRELTVPHPRMMGRRFVLEPLSEVWPDAVVAAGTTATQALAATVDQGVERFYPVAASPATVPTAWQVLALTIGAVLAMWWIFDRLL